MLRMVPEPFCDALRRHVCKTVIRVNVDALLAPATRRMSIDRRAWRRSRTFFKPARETNWVKWKRTFDVERVRLRLEESRKNQLEERIQANRPTDFPQVHRGFFI